jgi:hypothetical protein
MSSSSGSIPPELAIASHPQEDPFVTGLRIIVLGIAVCALLAALVVGVAWQALKDMFKSNATGGRQSAARRRPPSTLAARFTPERTRLRPYSPEVLAVVLVALAAGLWLSRLLS